MPTAHDKKQDERIAENDRRITENSEAIRQLAEYMRQIRNFHMPWAESEWKRKFRKKFYGPVLKILAFVTLWTGAIKTIQWYYEYTKIEKMAARYVNVANRMYYVEGNPDIALEFLDKAIKLRDGKAEYRFLRSYIEGLSAVRLLMNLGRPYTKQELDRVHRVLAESAFLQELEPGRPEPYLLQGQLLTALKEYDRAEQALAKAVELSPEDSFIRVRLATLKMERGDVAGAEESLAVAERLEPQSKWVWLWKGILANDHRKDPVAARQCYDRALEIDPKFDLAHYNRGWSFVTGREKRYDLAREEMLKALRLNPAYKEACYAVGMFYGYEDNYTVAKVWMDKAVKMDANFLDAYKWRGVICGEMKDYKGAVESLGSAILLDPMNADLYVRRAKMYAAMEKPEDAKRDLNFSLVLDAKNTRALLYLGNLEKDDDKAIGYYDRALGIDDKYDEAYAAKAKALARQNRMKEALIAIEQAIKNCSYKPERFEAIRRNVESGLDRCK